ncbi:MAG: hypothetical protein JOZ52_14705 [Acidobacteria bacterium]|nr:hypothetical protein [Acidobacteriota bacterium]
MKKFAYTIALMLVLVGSAFAQKPSDNGTVYAGFSFYEQMGGVETSAGTVDLEDNVTWGKTIAVRGETSDFNAHLNLKGVNQDVNNGNEIIGGTWSLTIYKGGVFQGVLFGEFIGGNVTYKADRNGVITAEFVEGAMVVKGGTGAYANTTATQTSAGKFLSASYPNTDPMSTEPASQIHVHNGYVEIRF